MPLGGYQGLLNGKVPARFIAHATVTVATLHIADLELTPLQADKSGGLLFGNNAICMIDPM